MIRSSIVSLYALFCVTTAIAVVPLDVAPSSINISIWKYIFIRKISRKVARKKALVKKLRNRLNAITPEEIEKTVVDFVYYGSKENTTVYLFTHGQSGNGKQADAYYASGMFVQDCLGYSTFNFPEVQNHDINLANLGQDDDICALYCAYKKTVSILAKRGITEPTIILTGLSRGSSATLNFLGIMSLCKPDELHYIKGAVLESPFAHMYDIYNHMLHKKRFLCRYVIELLGDLVIKSAIAPQYDSYGIHPCDIITDISPDIALLFISSKKDQIIPHISTEFLYEKLSSRDNVDHLVLNEGAHAELVRRPEYIQKVHQFYQQHNLVSAKVVEEATLLG